MICWSLAGLAVGRLVAPEVISHFRWLTGQRTSGWSTILNLFGRAGNKFVLPVPAEVNKLLVWVV